MQKELLKTLEYKNISLLIPRECLLETDINKDFITVPYKEVIKYKQQLKRTRINKDYPAYRIGNSKLEYKKVKTTITLFNQLKKFLKKGYDMKFLNNQLILYNHFLDSNNILNIEVSK